MNSLFNEGVVHVKFGRGIITSQNHHSIEIEFDQGISKKSFLYPDSFENFLKLDNEVLQKECYELALQKKAAIKKDLEEKRLEQERLQKEQSNSIETVKKKRIVSKKMSQSHFNEN